MTPRNEDFLFAQEATRLGYVTDQQIEHGFRLQRRMSEELQLDERLSVILVKRGWLAEEQARRVYGRLEPSGKRDEIEGYDIVEKLGSGSMGTVYKAIHRGLGRPVAIKILRSELAKEHMHVERLKEEAKLLASLDHPNIVRALDAGESGGFPFVVMEYIEGEPLKNRISRRGPLREVDALKITRAIADALERARRMGVVHRDVKPGNIVLSRQGDPKLMDLGLAKGPVDLGLTQHGATVGTPQFISPEQAQDPRRADTRSDIYSLGATLYAMLTGRPPFSGKTLAEVISKVLYQEPTPVRVLNRDVSPEAAYLVERMMLKDPALRYRTPAEVVRDIDAILEGRSIMPPGFRGNWEAHLLRRRYRRWMWVGAVAVVLVVLAAVGGFLVRERHVRAERARKGTDAVTATLAETAIEPPTDHPGTIREKVSKARSTLDLWRDAEPERLGELEARLAELEAEARDFRRFEQELRPLIDELEPGETGAYATTKRKLEAFEDEIDRQRSSVRRLVRDGVATVVTASNARFLELMRARDFDVPADLEEAGVALRDHAEALAGDFVDSVDLRRAREASGRALAAYEAIRRKVEDLEGALAGPTVRERLDAFDFQGLRRELEDSRRLLLGDVRDLWAEPEINGFGAVDRMVRHVQERLNALDRALDAQVESTWRQTGSRVREMVGQGDYEGALKLLDRFREAVDLANYRVLRGQVSESRLDVEARQLAERDRAARELTTVLEDVRQFLRDAQPETVRARVESALAGVDANWPFRDEVNDLLRVAQAQEALLGAALDFVERHRRLEDVRLRDGTVERRWVVDRVDRTERSVTILTAGRTKTATRFLRDVHPAQLGAWAAREDGTLEPELAAVVLLMSLDEQEPADLRPRIRDLQTLLGALERADIGGALTAWTRRRLGMYEEVQRQREDDVREEIRSAEYHFGRARYDTAYQHLLRLLKTTSELRRTDRFETKEAEILQLRDAVEAEIANKRLAQDFPAAVVTSEGDVTTILYDWESWLQLEVFRSGAGRACAVIEPYAGRGVVTPGTKNHRLHLLRGAEGLVRRCPMVLPSVFDPAHPITVSFDLYTGASPFFLAIDIDGLQVAVLSADPTSPAFRGRWGFGPDAPRLPDEKDPPQVDWYGKGRGVAFHAGIGFGDPTDVEAWDWPPDGFARNRESWRDGERMRGRLFAFEARKAYRVRIAREPGKIALFVDDALVAERSEAEWRDIGHATDGPEPFRQGTGLIQLWTWTPLTLDDFQMSGVVLERYR